MFVDDLSVKYSPLGILVIREIKSARKKKRVVRETKPTPKLIHLRY